MEQSKKGDAVATQAGEAGWQAQKSAMTRQRILDSAVRSFIDDGYSNVTTARVADSAGVSRGAMLHHFPSRSELIQASVEHLHEQLLADFTQRVNDMDPTLHGSYRRRAALDAYWDYLNGELFTAYHELCVASRSDEELSAILLPSQGEFELHVAETTTHLFNEWVDRGDRFAVAMDLTKFLMEGLALGQPNRDRKRRIKRLLDYLADRLEEIFGEEGDSAIGRHSGD